MTDIEKISAAKRLTYIASADLTSVKPKAYIGSIVEACNIIGLGPIFILGKTKAEIVDDLKKIGAERMREAARIALGMDTPTPPAMPPARPETRPQRLSRIASKAKIGITAAECNEFLRSLPRLDPENLSF